MSVGTVGTSNGANHTPPTPYNPPLDPTQGVQSIPSVLCLIVGPVAVGFYDKSYDQITLPDRSNAPQYVFHPKGSSTDLNIFPGARITCEDWGNGSITVVHLSSPKNIRLYTSGGRLVIEST